MRNLKIYLLMVLAFLLQSCMSRYISIAGCTPNFLIPLVVCLSVYNGMSLSGFVAVSVGGLLNDIACGFPWGVSVLIFLALSIPFALVGGKFYRAKLPLDMLFTVLITFIIEAIGYVLLVRSAGFVSFSEAFMQIILPACIYQAFLCIPWYFIIRWLIEQSVSMTEETLES
jgi:cell shape-determining protein MreD